MNKTRNERSNEEHVFNGVQREANGFSTWQMKRLKMRHRLTNQIHSLKRTEPMLFNTPTHALYEMPHVCNRSL